MHGQNQPLEQTPHLAPALTAVILGVVVLEAFGFYARSLEYRSITALAADEAIIERDGKLAPVKNQGTALQQAALDTGCLLPVYGSSELNLLRLTIGLFIATNLFHDRPTGFTIFPVGKAESTCLIILQKLAAVGPALQGRKVAVSLSPCWFFDEAHGSGGRVRRQFLRLARRRIGLRYPLESPAQAGCGAADAPVPRDRGESTAPSVRPGEPGRRLPPQPRLL